MQLACTAGARGGGSKGGRGTVCVVAWMRRRRRRMERLRKGVEKAGIDGEDGTGQSGREKGRDRWGHVDSARRKQVRPGPRSHPFH